MTQFTDTRHVCCNNCGEACVEVDANASAESSEGAEGYCDTCEAPGKVVMCDDEGQAWLEFQVARGPFPPDPARWVHHNGLYYPIESVIQ